MASVYYTTYLGEAYDWQGGHALEVSVGYVAPTEIKKMGLAKLRFKLESGSNPKLLECGKKSHCFMGNSLIRLKTNFFRNSCVPPRNL